MVFERKSGWNSNRENGKINFYAVYRTNKESYRLEIECGTNASLNSGLEEKVKFSLEKRNKRNSGDIKLYNIKFNIVKENNKIIKLTNYNLGEIKILAEFLKGSKAVLDYIGGDSEMEMFKEVVKYLIEKNKNPPLAL